MTKLPIRYAVQDDLEGLMFLEETSFESDLIDRGSFIKFIKNNQKSSHMMVCGESSIVGYILILTRKNATKAVIHSFAVAESTRGMGVGAELIERACIISNGAGYRNIMTHVRVDNPHAILRYKKSGFRIIGAEANYYEDGCDAVKYLRTLKGT